MLETLSPLEVIQLAGLLLGLGGGWGYIKSQVAEMKQNTARIDARHNTLERRLEVHIKESASAREDIAELKTDMKHITKSLDRIESLLTKE